MGNTFRPLRETQSAVAGVSGCGLWLGCWKARRWRCHAGSSISRARPATRSSVATRTAALRGSPIGRVGPIGRHSSSRWTMDQSLVEESRPRAHRYLRRPGRDCRRRARSTQAERCRYRARVGASSKSDRRNCAILNTWRRLSSNSDFSSWLIRVRQLSRMLRELALRTARMKGKPNFVS